MRTTEQHEKREITEYRFGDFSVDPCNMLLRRRSEVVRIPPKLFEILLLMVQNPQHTLSKDEILSRVWPDSFVEESNIAQCVFHLRKLLVCNAESKRYIETIPKRGYRFVAQVDIIFKNVSSIDEARLDDPVSSSIDRSTRDLLLSQRSGFSILKRVPRFAFAVLLVSMLSLSVVLSYGIFSNTDPKRTVVVARFSGDDLTDEDLYVPLAMTESLAAKIGGLGNLEVRSAAAVSDASGADVIITGSVSRIDGKLQVAVWVLNNPNAPPDWMRSYEIADAELLSLQKRIFDELSGSVINNTNEKDHRLVARRSTNNYEAYEAYSRGRYFWVTGSRTNLSKAISYFEKAVHIDPQYPLAYSGLADAYLMRSTGMAGLPKADEFLELARQYAVKALELDPLLAEPRTTLAATLFAQTGDWATAEREFVASIELNPNYSCARHWYALHLLAVTGDIERAESEMRKAIELNPVSAVSYVALGQIFYFSGRYENALEQFETAIELDPDFARAFVFSALTQKRLGHLERARVILETTLSDHPDNVIALSALGALYSETGLNEDAENIITKLTGQPNRTAFEDYGIALIESKLGRKENASQRIEKLTGSRNISLMVRLKLDPELDSLILPTARVNAG